jgi:threonylcarbamoyladenosine tRNA methylthiotransferase MtaB
VKHPGTTPPAAAGAVRIAFHTFGCKLNQFETEALASSLRGRGFTVVPFAGEADAYVINTCTVTTRADHKARSLVRSLARRRPGAVLVVTGCSAQMEAEVLGRLGPNIVVVPQAEKGILLDMEGILARTRRGGRPATTAVATTAVDPFTLTAAEQVFRTRAYLKIQDGCDSRCSYCRVPFARGPSVSLDPGEAVRRAAEMEAAGTREIVITGVHITSYSSQGLTLAALLQRLLAGTTEARFRLSSLEPEAIDETLCRVVAHRRVCPHFHLPVQSGADRILAAMRRPYRSARLRAAVQDLRSITGDPFLAADVITGFPGESEEDFAATRALVEDLAITALHVFPFSPRPGTEAAGIRPAVPERIRSQRARELIAHSRRSTDAYTRSWIGREVEVLVEERRGASFTGVSGNYLKLGVEGGPAGRDLTGRIVRARIAADGRARFLSFADKVVNDRFLDYTGE